MSNLYYRGDMVFLYVKFFNDKNKPIQVENPMVKIIHEKNGEVVVDLEWFDLTCMGSNEYFANYMLEHDADYSLYEVVYTGNYDDKIARVVEEFRVIPNSEMFENVIKLYGRVNEQRTGYPLIGTSITISSLDEMEMVSSSYTNVEGYWEAYVYPGEYKFTFSKFGFVQQEFIAQVGLEHNEIQFDNVALDSESHAINGNGIYKINDKYTTNEGMPIVGLNVNAYNVIDPTTVVGRNVTDENGEWQLFLDPGTYLLKVEGNLFEDQFDQTFRLKVSENGTFSFENLTSNVAVPMEENNISNGNGCMEVADVVLDNKGNPVIDVQINVFLKKKPNDIIAQDYTNPAGKWKVYLDPGKYIFEYYHPKFNVITEEKTIE
ncbi:hypothetical protein D3C81_607180 [compost metagenome]